MNLTDIAFLVIGFALGCLFMSFCHGLKTASANKTTQVDINWIPVDSVLPPSHSMVRTKIQPTPWQPPELVILRYYHKGVWHSKYPELTPKTPTHWAFT